MTENGRSLKQEMKRCTVNNSFTLHTCHVNSSQIKSYNRYLLTCIQQKQRPNYTSASR